MASGNLHTLTTVLSLLLQRRGNSYGRYAPNDRIHCVRPTTKGNVQHMKESVSYNGGAFTFKSANLADHFIYLPGLKYARIESRKSIQMMDNDSTVE